MKGAQDIWCDEIYSINFSNVKSEFTKQCNEHHFNQKVG